MSAALKCDVCGKLCEEKGCSHAMTLSRRLNSGHYSNVFAGDICDHCFEKLSIALTSMGCIDNYINKRAEDCLLQEGV